MSLAQPRDRAFIVLFARREQADGFCIKYGGLEPRNRD